MHHKCGKQVEKMLVQQHSLCRSMFVCLEKAMTPAGVVVCYRSFNDSNRIQISLALIKFNEINEIYEIVKQILNKLEYRT